MIQTFLYLTVSFLTDRKGINKILTTLHPISFLQFIDIISGTKRNITQAFDN